MEFLYSKEYYYHTGLNGFINENRADHRVILDLADFKKEDKILEIGCGFGVLLAKIPTDYKIGLETNKFAVKKCQAKGLNVILHTDAAHLPFNNNFFDAVIMNEVIEHIKKPGLVIKEIIRVLKSEGKFILTTPNKGRLVKDLSESHCSEISYQDLENLVQAKGFYILQHLVSGINFYDYLARQIIYPAAKILLKKNLLKQTINKTRARIDNSKMSKFRKNFVCLGTQQLLIAQKIK